MTQYDPATALIVVDVQNDFADPGGSLYVSGGEDVIPFINEQIRTARNNGAAVVYTQDWHPKRTPHFVTDGGIWPVHCVADSWGAAFHPDLEVEGDVVHKGTGGEDGYSGFTVQDPVTGLKSSTGLSELLRRADIKKVAIVGLALDYCVKSSGIDAVEEGFQSAVLAGGTRAVDLSTGDGFRAVAELVSRGVDVI